jgi:MSHA biogenesis protein MshP
MTLARKNRGMVAIAAIFLIVALVGLGVAMSSLSGVQADTGSKSLQAAKAYWGARAGLEWGIQRAVAGGGICNPDTNPANQFTLSEGALNTVSVKVNCVSSPFGTNKVYYFTSTATIGTVGQLGYAERRIIASVSDIP